MTETFSRRHVFAGLAAITAGSAAANVASAQSQGLSEAFEVLSDPDAIEVLKAWRGHLTFTIGSDGQMLAGWGYPQTVPEINSDIQQQLWTGTYDVKSIVEELRYKHPLQIPPSR